MQKSDIVWFAGLLGSKVSRDGSQLVAKLNQHFNGTMAVSHFMESEPYVFQIGIGNLACTIVIQPIDAQGLSAQITSVSVHAGNNGFCGEGMGYIFAMQPYTI